LSQRLIKICEDLIHFSQLLRVTRCINSDVEVNFFPSGIKLLELFSKLILLSSSVRNTNDLLLEVIDVKLKKFLKCELLIFDVKVFLD
jgi:hypothetical protein